MYLFMLLALWVGPVMTLSRFVFACVGTAYLLGGTLLEERNLREELGGRYEPYRNSVPMWLPRLTPWRGAPPGI